MFESSGESGEPCGTPPSTPINHTVGQHDPGLQHPADEHEQAPIVDSRREPGDQALMVDAIKGYGQHKPKRCNGRLEMIAANCVLRLPRRWQVEVASAA
jgi:hypothetical protein